MCLYQCPRCGMGSYERLKTHSYCSECLYSPTYDFESEVGADDFLIPGWAIEALMRTERPATPEELILKNEGEVIHASVA